MCSAMQLVEPATRHGHQDLLGPQPHHTPEGVLLTFGRALSLGRVDGDIREWTSRVVGLRFEALRKLLSCQVGIACWWW